MLTLFCISRGPYLVWLANVRKEGQVVAGDLSSKPCHHVKCSFFHLSMVRLNFWPNDLLLSLCWPYWDVFWSHFLYSYVTFMPQDKISLKQFHPWLLFRHRFNTISDKYFKISEEFCLIIFKIFLNLALVVEVRCPLVSKTFRSNGGPFCSQLIEPPMRPRAYRLMENTEAALQAAS